MNPTDILKDKIGTVAHGPGTSFLELFIQAHLVVQIVMVGLLLASVWSWAIIIEKIFAFRRARREEEPPDPGTPARPYSPREHYEKGEFLFHAKYGRGRVAEVRGDRVDVKFSDGAVRTFMHASG